MIVLHRFVNDCPRKYLACRRQPTVSLRASRHPSQPTPNPHKVPATMPTHPQTIMPLGCSTPNPIILRKKGNIPPTKSPGSPPVKNQACLVRSWHFESE